MTLQAIKKRLLDLAIRGQLVPQIPSEGTADNLLQQIADEHRATFAPQQGKKYKPLTFSNIPDSEIPFEIPTNWKWVRLGEIITLSSGKSLKVRSLAENDKYPVYGGNGINGYFSDYNVEKNTIIIGRVGFYCGSVYKTKTESWVTDNALIARIFANCFDVNFLVYILKHFELGKTANASAQPVVSGKGLYPLPIPLPPLSEQHRIVSKLDLMLKEISVIEESQKSLDGLSTAIWRRSLQEAIAGRLTTQLESDGTADILLDQIKAAHREAFDAEQAKAKAAAEKSGKKFVPKKYTPLTFSQIPQSEIPFNIPENWKWVRLGEICSFLSRGKSPKYSEIRKYPVFAQKCNLYNGWISLEQARFLDPDSLSNWPDIYKIINDDILINSTGTGTVCRTRLFNDSCLGEYPFVVPDSHVSVVRTYDCIQSKYVFYVISSKTYQDYMEHNLTGSTNQKELSIKVLANMIIPLPPLSEQERIVAKLDRLCGALGRD